MCRLSCTASLILSINELRSTLLPRTPSINHNLSSVLCPPLSSSLSRLLPSKPLPGPYLPAADSISSLYLPLTYFSKDCPHNTRLSICCLSVCCSVLCTCSLFLTFFTCISISSSCTLFPTPLSCTRVFPSFHGMVSILSGFFPPEIHILILPALQG